MENLANWRWLNEPARWRRESDALHVTTDAQTDFWQTTWYGFQRHSGHVFGTEIAGEFTFQVRVEGDFTTLYDQAGLFLMADEQHWLKAGIEYNDAQPMIGSVLTLERSDWATGIFPAAQKHFWLRLTHQNQSLRLQYSTDGDTWPLLRLCSFPQAERYFLGAMCCSPSRAGLEIVFSDFHLGPPNGKDLHDLS